MEFLNLGLIFILGTIIGSFLNVVIYRLGTGFSIHRGRSRCFSCNKTLTWYELIPIISFLLQKGRCKTCQARLSLQYPLVEFFTGILLIFSARATSFDVFQASLHTSTTFIFYAGISSLLVVLFVYDLKHKILPSFILYSFVTISFAYALFLYAGNERTILDIFSGLILAAPIFVLWGISRGNWIGFADGILFLGVGFLLGFVLGLHTFLFAFWVGACIAIILTYLLPRRFGFGSEIPFGPFIILATLFFLFTQSDILGVSLFYDLF